MSAPAFFDQRSTLQVDEGPYKLPPIEQKDLECHVALSNWFKPVRINGRGRVNLSDWSRHGSMNYVDQLFYVPANNRRVTLMFGYWTPTRMVSRDDSKYGPFEFEALWTDYWWRGVSTHGIPAPKFTHAEVIRIIDFAIERFKGDETKIAALQDMRKLYVAKLEEWIKQRDEAMLQQVTPVVQQHLKQELDKDTRGIIIDLLMDGTLAENKSKQYKPPPGWVIKQMRLDI
jgi:hypothetical protein